jgi:hypothetical protein
VSGNIRVVQQTPEGREQVMHVNTAGSVCADVPVGNSYSKRSFPQQTDKQLS